MIAKMKLSSLVLASVCIFSGPTTNAAAVPLKIARHCNALTARAFPPLVPGNPAAGRKGGSGREVQAYFRKCVAKYGHAHKHHSQS